MKPIRPQSNFPIAETAVILLLLAALSSLTFIRNLVWHDPGTLWSDVVSKGPTIARPHNNLGLFHVESGRLDLALEEFTVSATLNPGFAEAHVNRGNVLYTVGRLEEAMFAYHRAIAVSPSLAKAHYNLGNLYLRLGRKDDGIAEYEKALRLKPDYEKAKDALEELRGK